jgi:hypothetical protein
VRDNLSTVGKGFVAAGIEQIVVDELLDAFSEAKSRYYRQDFRPGAVEGGRFTEAVFRVLQWAATGTFTPLGKTLPTVDQLEKLLLHSKANDSIRIHIPRSLRLIYDIRNKRDAAHLGFGIDPNLQDATLVVRTMEWVLAELVRLYHNVSPEEAYEIIVELVTKEVPAIQVIGGQPRILKDLKASEYCLVLLYWRGPAGATYAELFGWVRPTMRANLRRTLKALNGRDAVHDTGDRWVITRLGEATVEGSKLVEPA